MDTPHVQNERDVETIPDKKWVIYRVQEFGDVLTPIQLNKSIQVT